MSDDEQPGLFDDFDPKSHARRGDPDTSHAAARTLRVKTLMRELLLLFGTYDGLTNQEAADLLGMEFHRVSKRLSDLDNLGFIEDTGRRRAGRSGRAQMVRQITDAGRRCTADRSKSR
jgi:predicted ArsR family transcriptional regulator